MQRTRCLAATAVKNYTVPGLLHAQQAAGTHEHPALDRCRSSTGYWLPGPPERSIA